MLTIPICHQLAASRRRGFEVCRPDFLSSRTEVQVHLIAHHQDEPRLLIADELLQLEPRAVTLPVAARDRDEQNVSHRPGTWHRPDRAMAAGHKMAAA